MTSLGNDSRRVMRVNQSNAVDVLCVIVLVAYFLHFALPAVGGGFPGHDMMNMYTYWLPGMLKSFQANICFWTSSYRPGGALYCLPLYHFFGLNPQPYRIVQVSILAASSNRHFIDEIFYQAIPNRIGAGVVLFTAWGLVFAYAFLRRDRLLQLMAFWVVITPLPLALVTIRGDACLYIPLFGWAMILAKAVSDSVTLISRPFATVDQGGRRCPGDPRKY